MRPAAPALAAAALTAAGLVGLAAYPRPLLAFRTLRNARRPEIDPVAVEQLATGLPDDADLIWRRVQTGIVPYAFDWQVYGVPYYFPTLAEALEHGRGDCKSQALVFGSLLAAKDIPFRLLVSPDHIWADCSRRRPGPLEDPDLAVAEFRDGRWHLLRPSRLAARTNLRVSAEAYWRAAPGHRRLVLVAALGGLALLGLALGARRASAAGSPWGPSTASGRRARWPSVCPP
jgi:hypothetical protein